VTHDVGRNRAYVSKRPTAKTESPPWKLLLWTAVAGLIFGLISFGEIAEDWLRASRNSLHWHKASGDIVLVNIDNRSLREVGRWPWPRRYHGQLTDRLSKAGAREIFFDLSFYGPTDPADDRSFAESIWRSGRVVLPVRARSGPGNGTEQDVAPFADLTRHARLGTISAQYNLQSAVWRLPYSVHVGARQFDSFAAQLAGVERREGSFMLDYSIDPESVPTISAADVLNGRFSPERIRGKKVIIGWTTDVLGDMYWVPGTGLLGGVYVQIVGAETLKSGTPVYLGWVPLFLAALAVAALAVYRRKGPLTAILLGGSVIALLIGPAFLESRLIFLDVTPGLFVILCVGSVLTWRRFRQRGLVNTTSGLPNLNALRSNREGRKQAVVAARVLNYEEIVATLSPESERQLVEQIVSRLTVAAHNRTLYQGDGGIFAWFEEGGGTFGNHLDALYALFRNPARVGGLPIDLSISFGVEIGSSRSLSNRLASALVAADEAAHDGLKWKYHDPESLEDASWKLSILSQLDSAIDRGEVWVAYQPKLDLATRRIIGAEALARWTHPEKGPIAASEFIAAAEQHDRIGKLTDFILEKAVSATASINKRGSDFDIAVNLSARLLTDKGFTLRVSALLARNGLAPEHLTLELTETAALTGSGEGLEMIARLRDLGIRISIDDYGTGLSTLDYLKKIPANEIKIDQSFVKGMVDNRSDRLMVQSTIGLAHSLGRKVVAEGVEQREILDLLIEMECDVAQGFAIGRPMSLDSLTKRLTSDRRRRHVA
jgi:EAL domain-containing protein (putative c-di-GMP-specific phosphodiesterase class I)/CHASE2 domain-containing sensor protein